MKKSNLITLLIITIASLFVISGSIFAQDPSPDDWKDNGNEYVFTDRKVGIGTTTPNTKLHVNSGSLNTALTLESEDAIVLLNMKDNATTGSGWAIARKEDNLSFFTSDTARMIIDSTGNVGIGSTIPSEKLDVNGNIRILNNGYIDTGASSLFSIFIGDTSTTDQYGSLYLKAPLNGSRGFVAYPRDEAGAISHYGLFTYQDNINAATIGTASDNASLVVKTSGNVGIGTLSPVNKLDVNGTIRAKEVKVESNWSDFVFEDNYNLPTLTDVESYIKENKHLPDIPSAKQVSEEGLSMAEMMAKQMQKIEELTLYLIEMKKENEDQSKEIATLKNELSKMKRNMN